MEEYTNRELGIMLENLCKEVKDGFKGVHDRQDKTNGNVIANKRDIQKNTDWRNKVLGALLVTQVMVIPLVLAALIEHFR